MAQASERPRRKLLSWESRCEIVWLIEQGVSPPLAAARGGASRATGYRLWRRFQLGGWAALRDRPSTPHRQPRRLCADAEQAIIAARRRSAYGPVRLAGLVPHPPSTIGKVLRRHGCSRLPRPAEAAARCARRYERERPGELLHVDTKKLGRFWEPGKRVLGAEGGRPHRNPADRLAAPARRDRRPLPARLRRAPARPGRPDLRRLPRARERLVSRPRRRDRAGAHRQRQGLPLPCLAASKRAARNRAPLHAHLPAAHQREGRALHPDAPDRMGLRALLPLQRGSCPRAPRLPALVQQTPTAQLARQSNPTRIRNQPTDQR